MRGERNYAPRVHSVASLAQPRLSSTRNACLPEEVDPVALTSTGADAIFDGSKE
jgi:hypothetical protein